LTDEGVEVWFDGYITLWPPDLEDAEGDFQRACQNRVGLSGAMISNAQDENDNYTLKQREGECS
jgi:hypothetical protein